MTTAEARGDALARPVRASDLLGVVLRQGPADPGRGARHLRESGSPHRGGRLGGMAIDRCRDPEQLHRRVQSPVVQAGRVSRPLPSSRPSPADFADVVDEKMSRDISSPGERAGVISAEAAALTGLNAGTPVAVANVDAHVSVPAATVVTPGSLVAVMGTSTCHLALAEVDRVVPGFCGVVEDGVIPGLVRLRGGPGRGRRHVRLVRRAPRSRGRVAATRCTGRWSATPRLLEPGESGLVALDWWNGNRSILVDAELTGLLMGATLATGPGEIYRALLEVHRLSAPGSSSRPSRNRALASTRWWSVAGCPSRTGCSCSSLPTSPGVRFGSPNHARPPPSARRCSPRWRPGPSWVATARSSRRRSGWPGSGRTSTCPTNRPARLRRPVLHLQGPARHDGGHLRRG